MSRGVLTVRQLGKSKVALVDVRELGTYNHDRKRGEPTSYHFLHRSWDATAAERVSDLCPDLAVGVGEVLSLDRA